MSTLCVVGLGWLGWLDGLDSRRETRYRTFDVGSPHINAPMFPPSMPLHAGRSSLINSPATKKPSRDCGRDPRVFRARSCYLGPSVGCGGGRERRPGGKANHLIPDIHHHISTSSRKIHSASLYIQPSIGHISLVYQAAHLPCAHPPL